MVANIQFNMNHTPLFADQLTDMRHRALIRSQSCEIDMTGHNLKQHNSSPNVLLSI